MVIRKGYVRQRRGRTDGSNMQKCPITGQLIPAEKMSSHLQVLLLDPQWKEQKDKLLEKAKKESAFAPESDVEINLATFVSRRPDLFGTVDDEVLEAAAAENDVPPAPAEIEQVTTSMAAAIKPPPPYIPPVGIIAHIEPEMKRARVEEEPAVLNLIPEDQFMSLHKNPIPFVINAIPGEGLKAVSFQIQESVSSSVLEFKERLSPLVDNLPANKMKLRIPANGITLRDSVTLAYFNIGPNTQMELSVKQRGGVKQ